MAPSQFPDVYHWISHLPPPSLWSRPSLGLPLPRFLELIAERTENGCVSFFIYTGVPCYWRLCLRRDIKWSNEEDFNHNNMQVITSPLLSSAIAYISHAIQHPPESFDILSMNIREVAEDSLYDQSSIAESSNYPILFNSAFASMCILICPHFTLDSSELKFVSPEILHPELDIAQPLIQISELDIPQPLVQILGAIFTYQTVRWRRERWEPLNWSYAGNTSDSCEAKIYCPLLSMKTTHNDACEFPNTSSTHLLNALVHQQVECIIQLRYNLILKENFLHFHMGIHNVRCDVFPYKILVDGANRDLASTERYFPSKISITIAPQHSCKMISVSQSSANPSYQIIAGQGWEVSYQAPKDVGVKASGTATSTTNINAWKFQQSAHGMNGTFKWSLYDSSDFNGKEVLSCKPQKFMLYGSKSAWYRDRYRKACSPFTDEGGVVFATDKYGESFTWTLNESSDGQSFKVKIEGTIWVTYWPNLHKTSFYESRYCEFCKLIELPLANLR